MSDSFSRAYTPSMQFLDENGKPLVGGFLCTYKAGTTTPIATLNDNGLPNQVRIPLNELGSPANGVQLDVSKEYKFVLLRADGTTVWTKDHVKAAGVGDVTVEGITELEEGSPNVHVEMSPDGHSASISVDDTSIEIDENLDTESQNPVENRAVAEAMNGKQDQLTEMTDQEINDLINSLGDL